MKVKVFTPNHSGKIEFTPAELEKLLNEVYEDGQRNCNCNKSVTWTSPYRYSDSITLTNATNATNTIDNHTQPIDKLICAWEADTNKNDTSIAKNSTIDIAPVSITLDNMDREAARKHISDTVAALRRAQAAPGDVFTNLAKELNF